MFSSFLVFDCVVSYKLWRCWIFWIFHSGCVFCGSISLNFFFFLDKPWKLQLFMCFVLILTIGNVVFGCLYDNSIISEHNLK